MNNRQRGKFWCLKTKQNLEKAGWRVDNCETWSSATRQSRDLFNIADLAAWHPDHGFKLIQVTARAAISARRNKIHAEQPGMCSVVPIEIHGWWRAPGARDFQCKIERVKEPL